MERPIESRALAVMREARGWKGNKLAAALGVQPDTYYDYERGRLVPSRGLLERAAAAMQLPSIHVDWTLRYLRDTDTAAQPEDVAGAGPQREIDRLSISLARDWEEIHRTQLLRSHRLAQALADREVARILFPRLRAYAPAERQAIVREAPVYQSWAFCELACHESIEAAADDADDALAWADLAVLIAGLAPGDPAFCSRTQGYAAFHRGNALRVKGQSLPASDAEFERGNGLWKAGADGDPEKLLNEARVLGMYASLRRDQGRLAEARALLDRALATECGAERLNLLINRSTILIRLENYEESLESLRKISSLLDAGRQPRLFLYTRFNILVALCQLEQYTRADEEIQDIRALIVKLGYRMGLAKLTWLQGWIATGLNRPAEAEVAFEQARREFIAYDNPLESALISLELAVLFLEQGRTFEVKTLARELAPVFQSQRTPSQTLATLLLFREAAERETLSLELARQFREELRRKGVEGLWNNEGAERFPGQKRRDHNRPGRRLSE